MSHAAKFLRQSHLYGCEFDKDIIEEEKVVCIILELTPANKDVNLYLFL